METDGRREDGRVVWTALFLLTLALTLGWLLATLQQDTIRGGWHACFANGVTDGPGNKIATAVQGLTRIVAYPLLLSATAVPAWLLCRRWRLGLVAYGLTLIVVGATMFWFDYTHNNGLLLGDWRFRCPSGRPPGWPSWLGIHPAH